MMKTSFYSLVFIVALLIGQSVSSLPAPILNVAANGYDVVAYQTDNKAKEGTTEYFSFYNGQAFLFSSAGNKSQFDKNPSRFLPAFGGYCAMGVAMGKKVPVDPEAFYVVDDVTYLNLNKKVQEDWLKDVPGNIQKANNQWPQIQGIDPSSL